MFIFALIGWIFFGLIVGAVARLLMPGPQPMGLTSTMLLGVVGSFVGGFLGYMIAGGEPLQAAGFIGSILGSLVVLWVSAYYQRPRVGA